MIKPCPVLLLIMLVISACNKKPRIIFHEHDFGQVIEFDIPKEEITNTAALPLQEKEQLISEINQSDPGLHSLDIIHFLSVPGMVNYYEIRAQDPHGCTMTLLAFCKDNKVKLIEGLSAEHILAESTRYEFHKDHLSLYKLDSKTKTSFNISYYYHKNEIGITIDDGFSKW